MSYLYDGNWNAYRNDMCVCPTCGKDEITHCKCDEEIDELIHEHECKDMKCSVCGINEVDVMNGYDTCSKCLEEI